MDNQWKVADVVAAVQTPVRQALSLPFKVLAWNIRALLQLSGLSWEDLKFPEKVQGRGVFADLAVRLARYFVKLFKVLFYPELLFRNVLFAIVFQVVYEVGGILWKKFRERVALLTAKGRKLSQLYRDMENAETYLEFRNAEKLFQSILGASQEALNSEEKGICDQLDRRFKRYRTFIRNNDVRRLQFELRSDLLRKHFGHDQFHPHVRESIQKYVGIVCCAFGLLASGNVPQPLQNLVYEEDENVPHDVHDSLDKYEDGHARMRHSASLVELPDLEEESDEEDDEGEDEEQGDFVVSPEQPLSSMSHLGSTVESKIELARSRLDFFVETRHSFGRSALLLSGGARMGLYHVGVVKSLMDHNMLPRVISGSSAGSIIAAVLGCKTEEEIRNQLFDPKQMNLRFFGRSDSIDDGLQAILHGDPLPDLVKDSLLTAYTGETHGRGNGLFGTLLMLLPQPYPSYMLLLRKLLPRWYESKVLLDINILKTAIRNVIGDMTFQEAFDRTGRIINITATPHGGDRDVPSLLNYLSAPYVTVWSAACASCCIPGVFAPVTLMAKTIDGTLEPYNPAGLRWIDGSLEADLPMQRLGELFNINHFIVSQVNPHAQILAPHDHTDLEYMPYWDRRILMSLGRFVRFCRDQGRSYLKHISSFGLKSTIFGPLGKGLVPILIQKYGGDVTLYPKMTMGDLGRLLENPTDDDYLQCILDGERMAWPKLQSIRRRCMVEFMLDDCVHAMKAQIKVLERKLRMSQSSRSFNSLSPNGTQFPKSGMNRVSSYSVFGLNRNHTDLGSAQGSDPFHHRDEAGSSKADMENYDATRHSDMTNSGSHNIQHFAPKRVPRTSRDHEDQGAREYTNSVESLGDRHVSESGEMLNSRLMGRIQSSQALSDLNVGTSRERKQSVRPSFSDYLNEEDFDEEEDEDPEQI